MDKLRHVHKYPPNFKVSLLFSFITSPFLTPDKNTEGSALQSVGPRTVILDMKDHELESINDGDSHELVVKRSQSDSEISFETRPSMPFKPILDSPSDNYLLSGSSPSLPIRKKGATPRIDRVRSASKLNTKESNILDFLQEHNEEDSLDLNSFENFLATYDRARQDSPSSIPLPIIENSTSETREKNTSVVAINPIFLRNKSNYKSYENSRNNSNTTVPNLTTKITSPNNTGRGRAQPRKTSSVAPVSPSKLPSVIPIPVPLPLSPSSYTNNLDELYNQINSNTNNNCPTIANLDDFLNELAEQYPHDLNKISRISAARKRFSVCPRNWRISKGLVGSDVMRLEELLKIETAKERRKKFISGLTENEVGMVPEEPEQPEQSIVEDTSLNDGYDAYDMKNGDIVDEVLSLLDLLSIEEDALEKVLSLEDLLMNI